MLASLFMLVPWDHVGLPHVTATVMGGVLLFAFADVARSTGKRVQEKLGTGTTPEQWYRANPDVAEVAKDRYRAFIASKLKLSAPTAEDELSDPLRANDFYLSGANWLREHTRDTRKFSILFNDNITYGFRRNLLGLKPVALALNIIVLAACGAIIYFRPNYFAELPHIDEKVVILIVAGVLHSAYILFAVGERAVREASRAYGRQLILSCETLMGRNISNSKRGAKDNAAR